MRQAAHVSVTHQLVVGKLTEALLARFRSPWLSLSFASLMPSMKARGMKMHLRTEFKVEL